MSSPRPRPRREPTPPPRPRARRGWHRLLPSWRLLLGVGLLGVIAVVGLFFYGYSVVTVPTPNQLASAQASIVYYNDGRN